MTVTDLPENGVSNGNLESKVTNGQKNHDPEGHELTLQEKQDGKTPQAVYESGEIVEEGKDLDDANKLKPHHEHGIPHGFFARWARFIARHPWKHFLIGLGVSAAFSAVGMIAGEFSAEVDNAGWTSRGTLIANRHAQVLLVQRNDESLRYQDANEALWQDLIDNVQPGWETGNDEALRRLKSTGESGSKSEASLPRHLQSSLPYVAGDCNPSWYSGGQATQSYLLSPLWKSSKGVSALDAASIRDICLAEETTQAALEANGFCNFCDSYTQCYPPFSLVFMARIELGDIDFQLSCEELANSWANYTADGAFLNRFVACVEELKAKYTPDNATLPATCPLAFHPVMVDDAFGSSSQRISYTASYFSTAYVPEELYKLVPQYDRAAHSSVVRGAYDTENEDFVDFYVNESVGNDMILAMCSAAITVVAILVHTRSPWLTIVGLVQIGLSFPLAYFVYTFIARLEFFPFLNFIGVFVVFALGADDVFVAVDKWKNARLDHRFGTVEEIAAVALPDAAGAMFLTTSTTAVAFFGTAICPVAPLTCFAVFCGLLILFDYIMNIVLVFPALCIYDNFLSRGNCFCCSCHVCKKRGEEIDEWDPEREEKVSVIRHILTWFYTGLHKVRWLLFVVCIGATITSAIFASRLTLPVNSDVRLLSSSVQYEQNWEWRQNLLHTIFQKSEGNPGYVFWGVIPADTGDRNNPKSWTQLVLDDKFDPSSPAAQEYLVDFCDRFFAKEFAELPKDGYICPINRFEQWLADQSNSTDPSLDYQQYCEGASGLPISQEAFNPCISNWARLNNPQDVLLRNGVVEVMYVTFQQRIRFDSPFPDLDSEWHELEDWFTNERGNSTAGVNAMYHSSADFWWYDTNGSILRAAFGSAGIAVAFSGLVVLFSTRSFVLTIFSIFTIAYVLTATTAMLVAFGWTLGFLESICFAILIGISCDFVLHFGHAYAYLPGEVSRSDRTKYALIRMGPSILAAGFTTICAAIVMLFTVISFFRQFAQILFFTILHATIGSFIMFLTLTDCIGPKDPTYLWDKYLTCWWCCPRKEESECDEDEDHIAGELAEKEEDDDPAKKHGSSSTLSQTEQLPPLSATDEIEA